LQKLAADLGKEIDALREELKNRQALLQLLPDVQVYYKAVDWAVRYDEFFKPAEVQVAKDLAKQGLERAQNLRAARRRGRPRPARRPRLLFKDRWVGAALRPRRAAFSRTRRTTTVSIAGSTGAANS
jgi:hypothetical protein